MRVLLTVASRYQQADTRRSGAARGSRSGATTGCSWPATRLADTGELYTYRSKPIGKVELLAFCMDQKRVTDQVDGWAQHEKEPDSLAWVRERVRDFGDPLPA